MKYILTAALLAALTAAPLQADDKPKEKPKDEKPTVQKKFQEITQEFEKAQEPLIKEFKSAKTDEQKEAVIAKLPKVAAPFAAKALKLAEANPKDPASGEPVMFALQLGKSERAGELAFEILGETKEFPRILSMVVSESENNPAAVK